MKTVVGFDCASKTGWCVMQNGKVLESGMQDFTKRRGESNGLMFLRFRKWLIGLIGNLSCPPSVIGYERAHFRGGAATEICVGMQTRVQEIAAEFGIEAAPVATTTLKKFACGSGKADKSEMMRVAKAVLGREPLDDNEADAVHVAAWAYAEFV